MLNCRQVAQLVSESLDKKLSFGTRMQLWMHLAMCGICSRFRKAILRIQDETKARAHEIENGQPSDDEKLDVEKLDDEKLTDKARERIKQVLDSTHG